MTQFFIDRTTGEELSEALFRRVTRERASLGNPIPADACDALGFDLIEQADEPPHDTAHKKLQPGPLVSVGPAEFTRGWVVVDLTPAELDAIAAEYAADLERVRRARATDINQARVSADYSYFEVGGKQIAVDDASMRQINGVTGHVALFGTFPPGFPGAWKAIDNSYHPLPDIDAWKAFVQAMAVQGVVNYARQQALKAEITAASTRSAILAVTW